MINRLAGWLSVRIRSVTTIFSIPCILIRLAMTLMAWVYPQVRWLSFGAAVLMTGVWRVASGGPFVFMASDRTD